MDSAKAALLAVATLIGLLLLAQGEGARASAISLRVRPAASTEADLEVRCTPVHGDRSKPSSAESPTSREATSPAKGATESSQP
jgi:hypothetical protein